MPSIYLVRHGEIEEKYKNTYIGHTDAALGEGAEEEINQLIAYFKHPKIDIVYASPLQRAAYTAQRVAESKNMRVMLANQLRDRSFGLFEGLTASEAKRQYPKEFHSFSKDFKNYCIPEGESLSSAYERNIQFIYKVLHENFNALIVAHESTLQNMTAYLNGSSLSEVVHYKFDPCTITKFDLNDHCVMTAYNLKL